METILTQTRMAGTRRRRSALQSLLLAPFATLLAWQEREIQRRHLAGLDPHVLKDIGLSQADVDHESGKPFWRG